MKTDVLAQAGDQVKANVAEFAGKAREFSAKVKEGLGDTYHDIERNARRAKAAAQERMEEARLQIKSRPLTIVAAAAGGAFVLGLLAGWFSARSRRS